MDTLYFLHLMINTCVLYFYRVDTCTQTIIPLVRKFCENAMQSEDSTLPVVAKQFGKLCHGLSGKDHQAF